MEICLNRTRSFSLSLVEEGAVLGRVFYINKHAHQLVAVNLPGVLPLALYSLCLRRHGPKSVADFDQRLGD